MKKIAAGLLSTLALGVAAGCNDGTGDTDQAKSVATELVALGIAATRLDAEGYGEQHAIADNATPEGRAKNRRTALSVRKR